MIKLISKFVSVRPSKLDWKFSALSGLLFRLAVFLARGRALMKLHEMTNGD
ncbi:hypothetical protein D1AOALGA4SA_6498 [Olavius algarvensis Delta 1 endosymbiont]|nr:hypothetical protein D1AOALGA4SA_6498 [Olavius algarvensis Delta 1 endosymbiont]